MSQNLKPNQRRKRSKMEKPTPTTAMQQMINVCNDIAATKQQHTYIESCLGVLIELVNKHNLENAPAKPLNIVKEVEAETVAH